MLFKVMLKINAFFYSNKYRYIDYLLSIILLSLAYYNYYTNKDNYTFYLIVGIICLISGITNFSQKLITKTQENFIKRI